MNDTVILSSILNVIMLKIKKLLSGKHMVHNFRLSSMYVNESQCMPSHAQVIACKCWKMSVNQGWPIFIFFSGGGVQKIQWGW